MSFKFPVVDGDKKKTVASLQSLSADFENRLRAFDKYYNSKIKGKNPTQSQIERAESIGATSKKAIDDVINAAIAGAIKEGGTPCPEFLALNEG